MGRHLFLILCALASGCGTIASTNRASYVPSETSSDGVSVGTRAEYELPREGERRGSVVVSSRGVVEIEPFPGAEKIRALHVRMEVLRSERKARETEDWRVDPSRQKIRIDGIGLALPSWVNLSGKTPVSKKGEEVVVAAGERQELNLFFELPEEARSASVIPEFEFSWEVAPVGAEATRFDRVDVAPRIVQVRPFEPNSQDSAYAPGWGPTWWHDRAFARWWSIDPSFLPPG